MIYISLGTNLGNRLSNLRNAIGLLKENYISEIECSIILETKAILPQGAPSSWDKSYLNMVIRGKTRHTPEELFQGLKYIEEALGRPKDYEKWAPRIIDLDILLWDESVITTENVTIPHPQLLNRDFLVHLIAMMDEQCQFPLNGLRFSEIAHKCTDINSCFIRSLVLEPLLVGVVNVTPDSFSDGNCYFHTESAVKQIIDLTRAGASMIDIGACATSPGCNNLVSENEEYKRLLPVFERLRDLDNDDVTLSLDSFSPKAILQLLRDFPIDFINIQNPWIEDKTLSFIAEQGCKIILMHSVSLPANRAQLIESASSPITTILDWAEPTLERLLKLGFSQDEIILDPGIGFGKSAYQSLALLKELKQLKRLGCQIMAGHSRKSFMSSFCQEAFASRDIETLAISHELVKMRIDYIRVHDIASHQRYFVANHSVQNYHKKEVDQKIQEPIHLFEILE